MVELGPVEDPADQLALHRMAEWHLQYTGSAKAQRVLDGWKAMLPKFFKVMPIAYRKVLEAQNRRQPREVELVVHG
jgi:glutamate synthase domain-containing protein 3